MIIGIDNDEVLAGLIESFVFFHNARYGTSVGREDFFSYRIWEVLRISQEEAIRRMYEFYESPYFLQIEPVPGSVEGVKNLARLGELVVVTSRPPLIADGTVAWLQRYFPETFSGVYFSHNVHGEWGTKTKGSLCKELGIDLFVEDCFEYAVDCSKYGIPVVMLETPWNRGVFLEGFLMVNKERELRTERQHGSIVRARSWEEIVSVVGVNLNSPRG